MVGGNKFSVLEPHSHNDISEPAGNFVEAAIINAVGPHAIHQVFRGIDPVS